MTTLGRAARAAGTSRTIDVLERRVLVLVQHTAVEVPDERHDGKDVAGALILTDDEYSSPMLCSHEAAAEQVFDGVPHGHTRDAEVRHERGFGGKPIPGHVPSPLDGRGKQGRNLLVHRTIGCPIDCAEMFRLIDVLHGQRPLTGVWPGAGPPGVAVSGAAAGGGMCLGWRPLAGAGAGSNLGLGGVARDAAGR